MRLREETKPKRRRSQCCIILLLLLLLGVRFYGYLHMCVIFLFNFILSPNDVNFFILHLDSLWIVVGVPIVVQSEVIISFMSEMFD